MSATPLATAINLVTPMSLLALSLGVGATARADSSGIVDFSPDRTTPTPDTLPPNATNAGNTSPQVPGSVNAPSPTGTAIPTPLTFSLPSSPPSSPLPTAPVPVSPSVKPDLFTGGSNALVARTVGHAEGTRSADGSKTLAYYGHTDPGNGVWNLGSFSFQHCREYRCTTPAEADHHQLKRLEQQAKMLGQRAKSLGIEMTLLEELNGIDLANQSPLAALGNPGYTEWLKQAHGKGLRGAEAVLWARVQSYWDPALNDWNAPGLGNREDSITHDQDRRLQAIARALTAYQRQIAAKYPPPNPLAKTATSQHQAAIAELIIFQDLDSI